MGDLSCIMPAIHPYVAGAKGKSHGNDFEIKDPVSACVGSAKLQLAMLFLLLTDDAKKAKEIISEYRPRFKSAGEYLAFIDSLNFSGDRIEYQDGKAVKVNIV